MKMKKYLLLIFSLSFLTACEDYVDINKSTTGVTDGDLEAGGLIYGTQLMDMQQRLFLSARRVRQPNRAMTWQLRT